MYLFRFPLWCSPSCNRIVQRSNHLNGGYGSDFKYREAMASGSLAGAGLMSAGMAGVGAMFAFSRLRNLAKRWVWALWGWGRGRGEGVVHARGVMLIVLLMLMVRGGGGQKYGRDVGRLGFGWQVHSQGGWGPSGVSGQVHSQVKVRAAAAAPGPGCFGAASVCLG